jgi:hypothetical protein
MYARGRGARLLSHPDPARRPGGPATQGSAGPPCDEPIRQNSAGLSPAERHYSAAARGYQAARRAFQPPSRRAVDRSRETPQTCAGPIPPSDNEPTRRHRGRDREYGRRRAGGQSANLPNCSVSEADAARAIDVSERGVRRPGTFRTPLQFIAARANCTDPRAASAIRRTSRPILLLGGRDLRYVRSVILRTAQAVRATFAYRDRCGRARR